MKHTTPSTKFILTLSGAALLIVLFASVVMFLRSPNARDNQDPAKQKEMMALVLEGGRLSPFPASATHVSIKAEGNSFTRSFRASFRAPKADIESWIKASPGLNETKPDRLSADKVQYIIQPHGANQAEVTIDYDLSEVEIYVSWS